MGSMYLVMAGCSLYSGKWRQLGTTTLISILIEVLEQNPTPPTDDDDDDSDEL